ncbi:hypothetical protein [Microbacterium sulfonylureivorans]|uniref:hypothetical protein n=1 Tax=Microbacterium sulfonylureivorans TaxID=2486854 RepID=UPI000FD83722|nr:hypothetical protein [Microbacterium sulfonylureivorans]
MATTTAALDIVQSQIFVSIPMSERWIEPQTDAPSIGASAHHPPLITGANRMEIPTNPAAPRYAIEADDRSRCFMAPSKQKGCRGGRAETDS